MFVPKERIVINDNSGEIVLLYYFTVVKGYIIVYGHVKTYANLATCLIKKKSKVSGGKFKWEAPIKL